MNNSNKHFPISQAPNLEFTSDYIGFLRNTLCQSDLLLIKLFVTNLKKHNSFEYSHAYMAKLTGLAEKTVRRSIKRLYKYGILESIWRPYDTCLYILNEFFHKSSVLSKLKWFFIGFFSLSSLSSLGGDRLLILKEVIYNKTCTSVILSNNIAAQDLYPTDKVWLYGTEKGEPNKKLTFEQFEALYFEEQYMNDFTPEQQQQLEQYSKETISYATKMLTKDMAAGKAISNQFAYFKSICSSHSNRTPKTGYSKPQVQLTPKEWQDDEDAIRERLIQRKQNIKAQAIEMDLYHSKFTIQEMQLMMKGYKVIGQVVDGEEIKPVESRYKTVRANMVKTEPVTHWNEMILPKTAEPDMITPTPYIDEQSDWEEVF